MEAFGTEFSTPTPQDTWARACGWRNSPPPLPKRAPGLQSTPPSLSCCSSSRPSTPALATPSEDPHRPLITFAHEAVRFSSSESTHWATTPCQMQVLAVGAPWRTGEPPCPSLHLCWGWDHLGRNESSGRQDRTGTWGASFLVPLLRLCRV